MASIVYVQNVPFPKDELVGWNSEFGRRMKTSARSMVRLAKDNAPVREGRLKGSIEHNLKEHRQNAQGIWYNVGSAVKYALFMESGTRPHSIPKNPPMPPGKYLVFFWPRVGKVVRMKAVMHPGTTAKKYLERALVAVISRFF